MIPQRYDEVPASELLYRGKFLVTSFLTREELNLGLAYLKNAVRRGNREAAEVLIRTAERLSHELPDYKKLIRFAAFSAISDCEYGDEGIGFLEPLLEYGDRPEILSAISQLREKKKGRDHAVTDTRLMIAEYCFTGEHVWETLKACRENLTSRHVFTFYRDHFDPAVNPESFDYICPEDAKLLLDKCYRVGRDPEEYLRAIRNSKSPYRQQILEDYRKLLREREEKSRRVREQFEEKYGLLNSASMIRDITFTCDDTFFDPEESEE